MAPSQSYDENISFAICRSPKENLVSKIYITFFIHGENV